MPENLLNRVPEGLIKPAATIASSAFLLSPLGIPFFVRGVPRLLLAGVGGFLVGQAADKLAENLGNMVSPRYEGDED